jgi:hypothetical protein
VRPKTSLTEITDWRLLLLLSVGYLACSAIVLREPFRSQLQLHTISLLQGMVVIGCSVLAGATRPLVEHAFWHAPRVLVRGSRLRCNRPVGGARLYCRHE